MVTPVNVAHQPYPTPPGRGSLTALETFLDMCAPESARVLAGQGLAGCRALSNALDRAIIELATPHLGAGCALIALGGYGRREIYRFAEVELLVLAPNGSVAHAASLVRPMWDAGLRVRYAV